MAGNTTSDVATDALSSDANAEIRLEGVTKRFGELVAVDELELTIRDGEFLVLLGPSGCGKSTTLRMIAGLETPSGGRISIGGEDVTETLPQRRELSMVFQSYALYPHKSVRGNLAFPLAKMDVENVDERIHRTAELLEIDDLLDQKPGQLSGGQRQRVALGRTIVREPRAFLMDEPLSNLDAKLRVQTRSELRRLQQQLGTTTVYVTHDQEEAMSLADRIAVMNNGELQQVGTPKEVYEQPANEFVAGFLGEPPMNFFAPECVVADEPALANAATLGIRPEDVRVAGSAGEPRSGGPAVEERRADGGDPRTIELEGEAVVVEPLGNAYEIEFDCGGDSVTARFRQRPEGIDPGTTATLRFPAAALHRFDEHGEVIDR
ncbi:ABC transporter ATP-binding protein [Natronococcus pandeyae]|uniref:ABC-type D-xylose/L-arabinose transporter n=1 Tax=Natronococcus pandeyae TaxID=2055836 RepID=A0A8J8TP10_9EURY|nr:ABC transporter ATP-binding protein [Natronococcus pandeyae]TYL37281.1 ABC transporter ATP-binding protein [Natronococcus pandeyae]